MRATWGYVYVLYGIGATEGKLRQNNATKHGQRRKQIQQECSRKPEAYHKERCAGLVYHVFR